MEAMQISMSGLDVEWQRLRVISENLANINTTRDALGQIYKAKRLLSGPNVSFESLFNGAAASNLEASGVAVLGVENIDGPGRRVHQPDHPHADEDGFVTYPDIDHATEMALMLKTTRSYEANLTALSLSRQMYFSALDMGK